MDNIREFDVFIVGGGPAGYTAALYLARAGYRAAVIEKLSEGGQMATTELIENYPAIESAGGVELAEKMKSCAEKFGAATLYETVNGLKLKGEVKIAFTERGEIRARAAVLAMGAYPRELGVEGEREFKGRGVAYCAACDGYRYSGMEAAVVGGGNSAAADALSLSKICKKVTLIHRRSSLRAGREYLLPLQKSGVEIMYDSTVAAINHSGGKFTGITVNNAGERRELNVAALFVAVGRKPATELLKGQVELDEYGYVIADETTKTNLKGVFAAGDLRVKPFRQIVTAAADGAVAAHFVEEFLR